MLNFHGKNFIGLNLSAQGNKTYHSFNPSLNKNSEEQFVEATKEEINQAFDLAKKAFTIYRKKTIEERALFLEKIAEEILAIGEQLLIVASEESGLPLERLESERTRTVNQIKLFASVLREGSWVEARIDRPLPERKPNPKPDLRRMLIPLGPVVIFGASNFPLAFSVAGGDSISALAAGNPIIVKVHPAHPKTSELVATAIIKAAQTTKMPSGIFSMLHGKSIEVGVALVKHPLAEAVGFTGSLKGGRAIYDAAASRPKPIPVYAEMGSTNPTFFLPGALKERTESLATGFQQSFTTSNGQVCTKPGMSFALTGENLDKFKIKLNEITKESPPTTMLHAGICSAFHQGIKQFSETEGVKLLSSGKNKANLDKNEASAMLFETEFNTFSKFKHLSEEVFGPSSLMVSCNSKEQLMEVANNLQGHLTASVHGTEEDLKEYADLIQILETKVGRIIINGFPTGLEVCASINHGGPYPATTDSRSTSVGTAAISRFARPICYQNFPQSSLPLELQNENKLKILRLVDNDYTRESIIC